MMMTEMDYPSDNQLNNNHEHIKKSNENKSKD
jgi:hypothetical protein